MDGDHPYHNMGVESQPINNSYKITTEKRLQQYKQLARIFFSLFLVCLVLLICAVVFKFGCHSRGATSRKKDQNSVIKFLHVSDIHLDFQYNNSLSEKSLCRNLVNITSETAPFQAPYGRVRCDSPEILVESALGFMRNLSLTKLGKIDFLMFTGDQVAHKIGLDYGNSTIMERVLNNMRAASNKIAQTFSGIPIFPSFGNNDLPGDYIIPKDSKFYEGVLAFWQPLILCKKCSFKVTTEEELKMTFLAGGYYKASIPPLKLVLLQLNSNYWNVECIKRNPKGQTLVIADAQIKWLENQLQIAKSADNKVIISGHIPPGINAFGAFDGFWAQNYTKKYVDLVTKTYSDTVIGQLFGHIHKDDLRLQMLNDKAGSVDTYSSFVFTAPGITPIYNNNPGFRIVTFNTIKRLLTDYHQYYMDLVLTTQTKIPTWLFDYSFSDKYMSHLPEDKRVINGKLISDIVESFVNRTNENRHWQNYIQHRQVNYQPDPYSRYKLYCAAKHVTKTAFDECVKKHPVTGG